MDRSRAWVIESELTRVIGALKSSPNNTEVDSLIEKLRNFKRNFSRKEGERGFLGPFLEVVRTDPVTAPVTDLALDSINKFFAYGYITQDTIESLEAQDLAVTVAHAKFVGVEQGTDEVVLMRVLEVLRSLMLSSVGKMLTDESVCEVLHSTFRICMENLLSELLRKMAEHTLVDMIRVLFGRLNSFTDKDEGFLPSLKKLKMISITSGTQDYNSPGGFHYHRNKRSRNVHKKNNILKDKQFVKSDSETISLSKSKCKDLGSSVHSLTAPSDFSVDSEAPEPSPAQSVSDIHSDDKYKTETQVKCLSSDNEDKRKELEKESFQAQKHDLKDSSVVEGDKEFVNQQGITFMPSNSEIIDESGSLIAYGIPCVRELFRFLINLINPYESNVRPPMIEVALSLLATALEIGAKDIEKFESLLNLVKNDLSKYVTRLISSESRGIFSSNLRIAFLIFSFFRRHLKFQLEVFFQKLMDVITSESIKVVYEHKESALDLVVRLYRLPGFITQVYLNYDCDIYTSNIFEDLTKMLSKNTFPLMGLHSTHFLSLDALLAVVDSIEGHCHKLMLDVKKGHLHSQDKGSLQGNDNSSITPKTTLTHEQLMALKHKKKLIGTATEQFNTKPSKGISFMQEAGLFQNPLDPVEVAHFLRENPHLDKKQLGDYISNRKNLNILGAFVKSFDFEHVRIDEALRLFLETFRLPGEAPLITLIMEHFADHWQKSNGDPLSSSDSAFTLAYAVIMLNVDQHNVNHTKKNDPMTMEQFCRNLRGTNGGADHKEDMLAEVYHNIRNNEIVMPAEQSGVVKENYLWKCVLKRGMESDFLESPNGTFDHELFGIIWGPTIAALSYVFDKASSEHPLEKSLGGFQKCATIAAHYSMIDVFDNLIISLCKFTTLLSVENLNKNSPFLVSYGLNEKALSVTRLVVSLVIKHGDILREGWKNIMECLLQLFRSGLLPETLTKSEDYLDPKGIDLLNREEDDKNAKVESGFLNSFVSFISMSSEQQQKARTPEEEESVKLATSTVRDCNLELIITESKFLIEESLVELVRALINGAKSFFSTAPTVVEDQGISTPVLDDPYDEKAILFFNEILVRITIENRDRVNIIWNQVVEYLCTLIFEAGKGRRFLVERTVTNVLRLCVRLARKEELVSLVMRTGLKVLLTINHSSSISRISSYGLYELLRNNAANIHESEDWSIVFDLMEVVGAGISICNKEGEDSGQGESDSSEVPSKDEDWIVLGENGRASPSFSFKELGKKVKRISVHDTPSFLKCCESVSFLVRDVAHITPHNFEACVSTLRLFVEAAYFGLKMENSSSIGLQQRQKRGVTGRQAPIRRIKSAPNNFNSDTNYDADESDNENQESGEIRDGEYHHVSLRLLDLMHTLHTRAGSVYEAWGTTVDLWGVVWCPLLQGMSRLCCDHRPQIRTSALTALQRSLLHTDLRKGMSSKEWESGFTSVLFPMLSRLLKIDSVNFNDRNALEETRTRAATLLGKVFLQHLTPLTELPTFSALWLTILDFMEKFIKSANTDLLADAIPESLKNMLLVMDTAGTFTNPENGSPAPLWDLTWDKLHVFLPNLMPELFGSQNRKPEEKQVPEKVLDEHNPLQESGEEKTHSEEKQGEAAESQILLPSSNSSSDDPLLINDDVANVKGEEMIKQDMVVDEHVYVGIEMGDAEKFVSPAHNGLIQEKTEGKEEDEPPVVGSPEQLGNNLGPPTTIFQEESSVPGQEPFLEALKEMPPSIPLIPDSHMISMESINNQFIENPVLSLPPSTIIPPVALSELPSPPRSSITNIPLESLGVIPPPPVVSISQPPPGIIQSFNVVSPCTGFQPIHAAEPPGGPGVPLASPKAVLPPSSTDIKSYFGKDGDQNLLMTSFTPNLVSSVVFDSNPKSD
ncbi:Golgi-specific brefeldin A-resistance guanine nucleotide exchange factor 1 [Lepeophtheirus salmonis]|uniref:Golgi-specific brefeldin A-resistance guanine nucleotide exchange factor 1 n=1 Tax=Lepeophtheirus salmonis TaxID=72036 RepID=UPI001AE73319|nr:Golgi-specific brefeldin A-resistance guanine nucleotide exchange factor 1-like [Lepeophtheirus salmonis]